MVEEKTKFLFTDKLFIIIFAMTIFLGRYFFPSNYNFWTFFLCFVSIYVFWQYIFNSPVDSRYQQGTWSRIIGLFSICCLAFVVLANFLDKGIGILAIQNLAMVMTPMLIIVYMRYIYYQYSSSLLVYFLKVACVSLNIYFWLNVPIIIVEKVTSSFMIAKFIAWNPYIPDSITGLIGYSGTNIINLFWVSLLILNFIIYILFQNKVYIINLFLMFFVMLYFSMFFNENKSFIPVLSLFAAILILGLINKNEIFVQMIKIATVVVVVFLLFFVLYYLIPGVAENINKLFLLANQLFNGTGNDTTNERAYLTQLAFSNYHANQNGLGLNGLNLETQTIHIHLGINSFTLLLFMGGLRFYLTTLMVYGIYLKNFFSFKEHRVKDTMLLMMLIGALVLITITAQPFRDFYVFFFYSWYVFIITVFLKVREEVTDNA